MTLGPLPTRADTLSPSAYDSLRSVVTEGRMWSFSYRESIVLGTPLLRLSSDWLTCALSRASRRRSPNVFAEAFFAFNASDGRSGPASRSVTVLTSPLFLYNQKWQRTTLGSRFFLMLGDPWGVS